MISSLQRIGLTPGKAIAIAVLTAALAAVWGPQLGAFFPAETAKAKTSSRPRRPTADAASPQAAKANDEPEVEYREKALPEFSVAEASRHDPFEIPAWSLTNRQIAEREAARTTPDEDAERFETLKQNGVAMILVAEDGMQAAQIGGRMVRVGDEIDGFLVTAIDAGGVSFTSAPPSSREGTREL